MWSRWFKRSSRLEHSDREVRLQALQALSGEQAVEAQAVLQNIVRSDPDDEVRRAALPHVIDLDVLSTLLDHQQLADCAAKQIAAGIKRGQAANCHNHALVLQVRIEQAQAADIETLWPLLTSPEHCAELALRLRDEGRVRVLEHPLLNNEEGLTVLQRMARGKDKVCHRYAKDRLDAIRKARLRCEESRTRLEELDASIGKTLTTEPADNAGLIAHRQKQAKLQEMRQGAVCALQEVLDVLIAAGAPTTGMQIPADPLAGVDLTPPPADEDPFIPLVDGWNALADSMRAGTPVDTATAQRDDLTHSWLRHADKFPPSAQQHETFAAVSKQFQAYKAACERLAAVGALQTPQALPQPLQPSHDLQALLKERQQWRKRWLKPVQSLAWPADHTPPPQVDTAVADLQRTSAEIEQIREQLAATEKDMDGNVRAATDAIERGQLEDAKRYLRAAHAQQKSGIRKFDRQLATLRAQVAEFRDWQQFATDPKRQELLLELQGLCDNPQEPVAQAARLKSLREQWRQLGRPASAEEAQLQSQFDDLADTAFAPCRVYFAEQAEIRTANLVQREALCAQLAAYLDGTDWHNADMDAAETILRGAREEWHKHHPCERRALKPVLERFEALQNQLHDKIKASWDANVKAKRDIVDQAQALLSAEVSAQVDGAKALQRAWRDIGTTPRGPDQRLWREFRQICDQIFAQRDAHHEAEKVHIAQRHEALETAINALQAAGKTPEPTRKALSALTAQINSASEGLTLNPAVRKRIERAQVDYRNALEAAGRQQEARDLQQWQLWDEQVSQAEQSGVGIDAPHPDFEQRAQGTAEAADWLSLTLEAEIAAELASPAEDQNARMALQVELMNTGRRNLASEDYAKLRQRWCKAGPKDASADILRERFFIALNKRL